MIIKHDDTPKKAKKKSSKKKAVKKVAKTEHVAPFPKQRGTVLKGNANHNQSTKFNEETTNALIACGAQGAYRQDVCTKVGISYSTLCNWLNFGKKRQEEIDDWDRKADVAMRSGQRMPTDRPIVCSWTQFRANFLAAELTAKEDAEKFVKDHRKDHWQASAWWLEKRYALEYGSAAGRVGIGEHARFDDSDSQETDPEAELLASIDAWEDAATAKRDS